ncbi:hypothetical protein RFI_18960, partial [Reticulomyxa filosa]
QSNTQDKKGFFFFAVCFKALQKEIIIRHSPFFEMRNRISLVSVGISNGVFHTRAQDNSKSKKDTIERDYKHNGNDNNAKAQKDLNDGKGRNELGQRIVSFRDETSQVLTRQTSTKDEKEKSAGMIAGTSSTPFSSMHQFKNAMKTITGAKGYKKKGHTPTNTW